MRACAFLLLVCAAAAPAAAAGPFGKAPVSDADLGRMRGGFLLPGGLDVSIAVQSSTSVDGTPVLRTLFIAASGGPSLTVFGQNGGGLTQIDTSSSGGSAGASGGTVRVEGSGSGTQVILTAPQLEVRHLVGQAVGSMVANSGNDVTIDVDTVVDIQIGNGNPLNLGPNMLRVDTLASDVAARLVR
ncbi:MAG TPA: hypothetical protein VF727_06580 [Allosphingosinicella sp.]|jgi:hypothetical protein